MSNGEDMPQSNSRQSIQRVQFIADQRPLSSRSKPQERPDKSKITCANWVVFGIKDDLDGIDNIEIFPSSNDTLFVGELKRRYARHRWANKYYTISICNIIPDNNR